MFCSKRIRNTTRLICIVFYCQGVAKGTAQEIRYIPAEIDFSEKVVDWDGFGFNYVETAQTRDFKEYPQDYGGFSLLSEEKRKEVVELVFGEDGLKIELIKMFLDPYHQPDPEGEYDHEKTTVNMRAFVSAGIAAAKQRGDQLEIITTLYGPPAWANRQKFIGGRDLDTAQAENLCRYMTHWTQYLKANGYPVKYLSLHNEGEDFYRWNFADGTQRLRRFDFNMYWPPKQVNDFLKMLPGVLKRHDLGEIQITNGEPSNWTRFHQWGYTDGLTDDTVALSNLGLLTTHGFINGNFSKLSYGTANSLTTDALRALKPGLHAWVTSFSWGNMGLDFVRMVHEQIYTAKVNALIPWAGIQNPAEWIEGDPNPGTAIRVDSTGDYEVTKGYYFYKQLTLAGRRGMYAARARLSNPQAYIIAFGENQTDHPDSFVLSSNIFVWGLPIEIEINGSKYTKFKAYRTSEDGKEQFKELGIFQVTNGTIIYDPPQGTTTTFIGVE